MVKYSKVRVTIGLYIFLIYPIRVVFKKNTTGFNFFDDVTVVNHLDSYQFTEFYN